MTSRLSPIASHLSPMTFHTELHSKIERGEEEEATEAYILVRRVDDDEGNEAI
jgi:hypothetical protein